MSTFTYTRITTDEGGGTRMEPVSIAMRRTDYAPPAAPLDVAPLGESSGVAVIRSGAEWAGETFHPAPARQWMFVLSGSGEVTTSSGDVRRFGRGDAFLFEDTEGSGHSSRFFEMTTIAVIQLDDV